MTVLRVAPAVLLVAVTAALPGCARSAADDCHSDVVVGPMPEWADAGFSPGSQVLHVVGDAQQIVAVPFSQPLVATAEGADPQNKVLLVARTIPEGSAPLTVEARREGSDEVVVRQRPDGPGPGTLDLPEPGCWNLTLRWADQQDTLALEYVAAPTATSG